MIPGSSFAVESGGTVCLPGDASHRQPATRRTSATLWRVALFLFIGWVGIDIVVANDKPAIARDEVGGSAASLAGKRLFFDIPNSEGKGTISMPVSGLASSSSLLGRAPDSARTAHSTIMEVESLHPGGSTRSPLKQQRPAIRYDAWILRDRVVRVIVNGLPCSKAVQREGLSPTFSSLNCNAAAQSGVRLRLLDDLRRIEVVHHSTVIGVLLPGQTL